VSIEERLSRMEEVLGTLIAWLCYGALTGDEVKALLEKLEARDATDMAVEE
jgi:hypothetical protein